MLVKIQAICFDSLIATHKVYVQDGLKIYVHFHWKYVF